MQWAAAWGPQAQSLAGLERGTRPCHPEARGMVQADAGAQVVQIFDSWASQLSPQDFEIFSAPYIKQIISDVRKVTLQHFLPPTSLPWGLLCV